MDRRNRGSQWVLIAGILTVLLGLIHVAATPVIFSTMSDQLSAGALIVLVSLWAATQPGLKTFSESMIAALPAPAGRRGINLIPRRSK